MQANRVQTEPRKMHNQPKDKKILRHNLWPRQSPPGSRQSLSVTTDDLQTFLGLANYMGPFITNLSSHTAPVQELLKENNEFKWSPSHQVSLDKIKESISREATLTSAKERTMQVDASLKCIGAVLFHDNKPVAFASKALTDTESRYVNIEHELLAIIHGGERFHIYIYGCSMTVQTDHKPLESIHVKHLMAALPRLQRMLLRLQPYHIKIQYTPGREMGMADAFSRLSPDEKGQIANLNIVHEVLPQFSKSSVEKIAKCMSCDPELVALKELVYIGWPQKKEQVPQIIMDYQLYRDELTTEGGVLLETTALLYPEKFKWIP